MTKLVMLFITLGVSLLVTLISPTAEDGLEPPTFTISSHELTYDGERHTVGFDSIEHPRLADGHLSLEWYREGELVSVSGSGVSVRDVSDSGVYTCRLTFTLDGESVSVDTPPFNITVRKAELDIPTTEPLVYTGMPQLARLYSTSLYSVVNTPYTDAGVHSVSVILADSDNYTWRGCEGAVASVPLVIMPAENFFAEEPRVSDYFAGERPSPQGLSAFGEVEFLYSDSYSGSYTETPPASAGGYYFIARVEENENFAGLETSPRRFYVIEDTALGMRIETAPGRTRYLAFDEFSPEGLSVLVTYASGRFEVLDSSRLGFEYVGGGDSFRYGESGVYVTYLDLRLLLPITVERRKYDLSSVIFGDVSLVYNGERQSVSYTGELPKGLDGISPTVTVMGGGSAVGSYPISLVFSTESRDYEIPEPISALLHITPMPVTVEWEDTTFVYDGGQKSPRAFFTTEHSERVELSVSGAAHLAGDGYLAIAVSLDDNYTLVGDRCEFRIAKARYDTSGIVWVGGGYTYDGSVKEVSLAGLPAGVTVIGYSDNRASLAGEYHARAILRYDARNYEAPEVPECVWSIARAGYDISGISLKGGEFIYDGYEHLPTVIGRMPIGIDGIPLTYELSRGPVNVSDGRVSVELRFYSASPNYVAPDSIYATVSIIPREVVVLWQDILAVYDGEYHAPIASAAECDITVSGGGILAGEYEVLASTANTNYTVKNYRGTLIIRKAENRFTSALAVDNIFEGDAPHPSAEAYFGEVSYRYYHASDMSREVSLPLSAGEYFVVAVVPESENYLALVSSPVAFSVVTVVPVSIEVTPRKTSFRAFESITPDDIFVRVACNDGSSFVADFSTLEIIYESGDSFRFSDSCVTVRYGDFSSEIDVSVSRADYDMSGVRWSELTFTYDGKDHRAELLGLPEGVRVVEYIGGVGRFAGSYPIEVVLDYDEENYNPPKVAAATLIIAKKTVKIPTVPSLIYDMKEHEITISADEYYQKNKIFVKSLGKHTVDITLRDPENFVFENGSDSAEVTVSVLLGKGAKIAIFCGALLLLLLLLILIFLVLKKRLRIRRFLASVRCHATLARESDSPRALATREPPMLMEGRLLSVDTERADALISDSLARDLVVREEEAIYTDGRRKSIVNVDSLSEHFASGDRVDVNSLKAIGLVPQDTAFVKVLARGVIDKPLSVYANDFSPAAVKMIALTGGEARRVVTLRKKGNKKK